jgi:hypothetical protein
VPSLTEFEFDALLRSFEQSSIYLETRDAYGTAVELSYLAKWGAGEPDDLAWLDDWCSTLREHRGSREVGSSCSNCFRASQSQTSSLHRRAGRR